MLSGVTDVAYDERKLAELMLPLGDPEPVAQHGDGAASTVRGQKFPSASS